MKIKGVVAFIDLEGGFWGIKGDDGMDYRPSSELPQNAKKEGARVEIEAKPAKGFSFFMWGTEIEIEKINVQ